jgi:hypothetical protein
MTKNNKQTEEARVKDLFRKIDTQGAGSDFTMRIMQKISVENIVIEKKIKPFNWFPYIIPVILIFMLTMFYLPELTRWTDYMVQTLLPNYIDNIKGVWIQLQALVTSLRISPLVLIILGSCTFLFTLVGLANAGEILNER